MKCLSVVAMAAGLALGGAALAQPVLQVTNEEAWGQSGPRAVGGPFEAEFFDFPFEPQGTGEHGATELDRFITFGVEAYNLARYVELDVQFSDLATEFGAGGGDPDPLDERSAYLYTSFIKGTLADDLLSYSGDVFTYLDGDSGMSLQEALWFIEEEIPIVDVDPLGLALLELAEVAIAPGGVWYGRGIGDVRVMNLWRRDDGRAQKDMLVFMPDSPPPGDKDCCEDGKPQALLMQYTGDDCSASNHSQDPDGVYCWGDPNYEQTVFVIASNRENPWDCRAKVWFAGEVELGGEFVIDAREGRECELDRETWVFVFDLHCNLLQKVAFQTSCKEPLVHNDQFGSVVLLDCVPCDKHGGGCHGGGKGGRDGRGGHGWEGRDKDRDRDRDRNRDRDRDRDHRDRDRRRH